VHTDTRGNDLPQPENVRIYLWSSSQHFADPRLRKPTRGICQNVINVVWTSMLFRGMLDAMDAWASKNLAPPDSRIPRRSDGTLVTGEEYRQKFPAIPGVAVPRGPSPLERLDFGPEFDKGVLAEPPKRTGQYYTVLVPAPDADGNDRAGVRAPMVQAPLATYTGWNLRARGFGHGAMFEFSGSTIPLPETPQERTVTGDPRPSVLERYPCKAAYQKAIEEAAQHLVASGLMVEEDVSRCVQAASDWGRPRHDITLD
jgi:hypothetical protein